MGENLPWRRPRQEIRVKASMRRPSCFSKKKREKEKRTNKTNFHWLIAGCKKDILGQVDHSKQRQRSFLCLLQEVSYLLQEAYKKAKLISKEDLKAWNMSMRPTLIYVSTPHPFYIILFMSLCFFPPNCVFYRMLYIFTGNIL